MEQGDSNDRIKWMIACLIFFINAIMFGVSRISGLLFVATVTRFGVSREKASFPYTLSFFVKNVSVLFLACLQQRFGVKALTTTGCLLSVIGIGMCFFVENVNFMIVLWGFMFGFGLELGTTSLLELLSEYFYGRKTTASIILSSGAAAGSFVAPVFVDFLLNFYGLSGTFLLLSGLVLNCIPAALLLKRPIFEESDSEIYDTEKNDRKSTTSEIRVRFYTPDDISQRSFSSNSEESGTDIPKIEIESVSNRSLLLTYEEKIERLSTQTLMSDYLVRLSCADALNVDRIIENSKGRKMVDRKLLQADILSLYSFDTEQDVNIVKDNFLEKRIRFASVQYQKPLPPRAINQKITISSESIVSDTGKSFYAKTCNKSDLNYHYETDVENFKHNRRFQTPSISFTQCDISEDTKSHSSHSDDINLECSHIKHMSDSKTLAAKPKMSLNSANNSRRNSEGSEKEHFKVRHKFPCVLPLKDKSKIENYSSSKFFRTINDPFVILIIITYAIYNFTLICILTIVIDYAHDLNVSSFNGKYIIMMLSAAELVGLHCFRWIMDNTYMTTICSAALCFACQGAIMSAMVWSTSFVLLMTCFSLYGLACGGLTVILPVIISRYIDDEKMSVVTKFINIISGLYCLSISPSIGYFRDQNEAYDYIFYGLSALCIACCCFWMFVPCILRLRR